MLLYIIEYFVIIYLCVTCVHTFIALKGDVYKIAIFFVGVGGGLGYK
jgi:hypothetical protein